MKNKAQAIIMVIAFLTMLFVVGIAFFVLSQTERSSSHRHLDAIRARYIAEAGAVYAQKIIKMDISANPIDSLEDLTFGHFHGEAESDADLDEDGEPDSRWLLMPDKDEIIVGRFSVKISDESSKLNIHSCEQPTLDNLFSELGVSTSRAGAIISRRPFNAIEEVGPLLGKEDFAKAKKYLTIYSRDLEMDLESNRRIYLNSYSPRKILESFLSAGIANPYQKAANLVDASDGDVAQTVFDKFVLGYAAPSLLAEPGGWLNKGNYFESLPGTAAGKFQWINLLLDDGEYYCFLYGPDDDDVVGMASAGESRDTRELIYSGDGLTNKVSVSGGSISLYIEPLEDKICRFSYVELVSPVPAKGMAQRVIAGTEGIVINEIMVKLTKQVLMDAPVEIAPAGEFNYTFSGINPGRYYAVVIAQVDGGLVGKVTISGRTAGNLYDENYFPYTVDAAGGSLAVKIVNDSLGQATFYGLKLLQQPDAEYIELLNLTDKEIDLSNFTFDVYDIKEEKTAGWPARIPEGVKIPSYQYLVCCVDANDSAQAVKLRGNSLSFQGIWGKTGVNLQFDEYGDSIDKTFDLLPDSGGKIVLKDASGRQVDAVEYSSEQVSDFVSIERPDPSAKDDGVFDGWYNSEDEKYATPAAINENAGMYTEGGEAGKLIKHSPNELAVYNRKLENLAQAIELSSGHNWKKFTIQDLSRMRDKFAVNAVELSLSGNYKSGDFKDKGDYFESAHQTDSGIWEFSDLAAGNYLLSIHSNVASTEGAKILVSYKTDKDESFSSASSLMFERGIAFFGYVDFGTEEKLTLQVQVTNISDKILGIQKFTLEPVFSVDGRINVNTAEEPVLKSIFSSGALAQKVLDNRPVGMSDAINRGTGELFLLDSGFLNFSESLTVKSDIYEILCRGESYLNEKTSAFQTVRVVLERGEE